MTKERKEQVQYLLVNYLAGQSTKQEETLLFQLLDEEPDNTEWELLLQELMAAETTPAGYRSEEWQPVIDAILQHTAKRENKKGMLRRLPVTTRIIAAACILLLIGIGAYFLFFNKPVTHKEIVNTPALPADIKAPETNRAMITLANGQKVYLDSSNTGQLAMQGNMRLVKLATGEITYESTSTGDDKETQYNTLFNPRGSQVATMILADGTKVWLNAGSSVTYPVAFIGNERKVSITGEAYFEVTHDASKPFYVSFGTPSGDGGKGRGGEVEVLGTHFNINSYDDEEMIRTTLLEGKVKISSMVNRQSAILKPGQQAVLIHDSRLTSHNSRLTIYDNIDTDQVMAWKNGLFSFNKADIKTVMREVARWYDVEVSYKGVPTSDLFGGDIQRSLPLSKLLDFLEKSQVHFVLEGKKLTVMP